MRPVLESEHYGGSVRTIRSSWNINDVTIDVIELERKEEDDRLEIKRAWVFHDDIFILLTGDNKLFTSVEVSHSLLPMSKIKLCRVFTTLSTSQTVQYVRHG